LKTSAPLGKLAMPWWVAPPKMLRWKIYAEQLWQILRSDVPVIKIDNVADYYFTGTDQEHWNLTKDSPTWRPFELGVVRARHDESDPQP
jgi:hypothetical protein